MRFYLISFITRNMVRLNGTAMLSGGIYIKIIFAYFILMILKFGCGYGDGGYETSHALRGSFCLLKGWARQC